MKKLLAITLAVLLSATLVYGAGFPSLPSSDKLMGQTFGTCSDETFIEVTLYDMSNGLQWVIYRDMNDTVLAILVLFNNDVVHVYALIDNKVREFDNLEDLGKVAPSACNLLPKKKV